VTRQELERRITSTRRQLEEGANGEYALELEANLRFYEGMLARIPKED